MSKILDEVKGQGQEEGLEKGLEKGRIEVARAMLAEGDSVQNIRRVTGLPQATIDALKTS